jgi:hypothetical protein
MNKLGDSFEDNFKKVFNDAEWSPPNDLWNSIEHKLDLNNRISIEDTFRTSFLTAEITPPEDIWRRIENDLRNRKIRMWTFRSLGVAAVLLLSFGAGKYFVPSEVLTAKSPANETTSSADITPAHIEAKAVAHEPVLSAETIRENAENNPLKTVSEQSSDEKIAKNALSSSKQTNADKIKKDAAKNLEEGLGRAKSAENVNQKLTDKVSPKVIEAEKSHKTAENGKKIGNEEKKNLPVDEKSVIATVETPEKKDLLVVSPVLLEVETKLPLLVEKTSLELVSAQGLAAENTIQTKKIGYFAGISGMTGTFRPNYAFAGNTQNQLMAGADSVVLYQELQKNPIKGMISGAGLEFGIHFNEKIFIVSGIEYWQANASFSHTPYKAVKIIDPDFQEDTVMTAFKNTVKLKNTYFAVPLRTEAHLGKGKLKFLLSGGGVLTFNRTTRLLSQNNEFSYDFGRENPFGALLSLGVGLRYDIQKNLFVALSGDYRSALNNFSTQENVKLLPENALLMVKMRYIW